MSGDLETYRRKRRPAESGEPAAGVPVATRGRGKRPRFSIQEHSATGWHFDLRLEHDGVLTSYALPRGLPLDPAANRMAIHTEDHPLEYLRFEGTIPAGNYGAGTVSVYDHGTYEAEKWRADEIIVSLRGRRVRARYALFRAGADPKAWLIHRIDPAEPADPYPDRVPPMLAAPGRLPADERRYSFEVKWDGMRAIAHSEPGRLRLQSRTGRDISAGFPEIHRLQRQLGARRAVLDGEIVVLDAAGVPSFQRLQSRIHLTGQARIARQAREHPAVYMIFDLLYLDSASVLALEHHERRGLLEELGLDGPAWRVPGLLEGAGEDVLEASRRIGLEGIIAKRRDSAYEPGRRSPAWLKIKNALRQEFVIGGYTAGTGRRERTLGALLVGYHCGGGLCYAGRVGTGFRDRDLDLLVGRLRPLRRARSPFAVGSPPAGATFVRPSLVCECSFAEWTSAGLLRQPSFLGLRTDRPAAEVVREITG